jgi:hypothetical protein
METTDSTENQDASSDERLTLCLTESWQARTEVVRADLELQFREDLAGVFEKYGSVANKVYGRHRRRGEPLSDVDVQVFDFMREVDRLVAGVAHDLFFVFAEEATWGESETWDVRRALEQYLPDVIDKTFWDIHPFAKLPGAEVAIREPFSRTCEMLIKNGDVWKTLQGVLRKRAESELGMPDRERSTESPTAPALPATETQVIGSADLEAQKAERRHLRDEYGAECRRRGVRVTDEMISSAANPRWKSRTQVQKWLACDPRYDGEVDRLIRAVFTKKPHLSKN